MDTQLKFFMRASFVCALWFFSACADLSTSSTSVTDAKEDSAADQLAVENTMRAASKQQVSENDNSSPRNDDDQVVDLPHGGFAQPVSTASTVGEQTLGSQGSEITSQTYEFPPKPTGIRALTNNGPSAPSNIGVRTGN